MILQCPVCKRWVETYAAKNARGRGHHRRFDRHEPRYSEGRECDMSDEPTATAKETTDGR